MDTVKSQAHRSAYKRYWRNRRNYFKAVDEMNRWDERADRSLELMFKAAEDMGSDVFA